MCYPMANYGNDFWINPCGMDFTETDSSYQTMDVRALYDEIITNANVSRLQIIKIKQYLERHENIDERSLLDHRYEWLQPPEPNVEEFRLLDRDAALKGAFHLIQSFAVAFDQMVEDQKDMLEYCELLADARRNSIQLLCSLQMAMLALRIIQLPDATRDIMSPELRNLNQAAKITRDYLILRDYEKAMIYIHELLLYFIEQHFYYSDYQ